MCAAKWGSEWRRQRWKNDPELGRRERARANGRRRARLRGNGFEDYDRLEVCERDGWICQLCFYEVDREAQWPHPLSAAIDHIVPIAVGGPDILDNVQLAHQGCNWRKSSKDSIGCNPRQFIHPAVIARYVGPGMALDTDQTGD
ncbi:HNH endonuclease [Nonomuraea sp. FMUSA5-5]|uniref:HNH endonuclease n=2 Tax=Nonomuraea composti TaxID=2720023 RepID=A0ABX1BHM3_9ACTN|nr:HNH endonuclease [Nonomuraea sp. FMUSA5-5]